LASLTIRPATLADLDAVIAMLADDTLGQTREVTVGHPAYLAGFRAIEASPNDELLVAEEDGAVVGCFQLSFLPGLSNLGAWRGQIEAVRVASGRRGGGLGRQMMVWAIERCRARGCGMVQLTSNGVRTDAHRFYRSLGFEGSHLGMKLKLPR
jgi:GNAT superfamily N-acetyltransferase